MWMAHVQGTGRWEFFTETLYGRGLSVFAVNLLFLTVGGIRRNRLKLYPREGGMQGTAGLTSMYKGFAAISIHLENSKAERSHLFLSNKSSRKDFCSMRVICRP